MKIDIEPIILQGEEWWHVTIGNNKFFVSTEDVMKYFKVTKEDLMMIKLTKDTSEGWAPLYHVKGVHYKKLVRRALKRLKL